MMKNIFILCSFTLFIFSCKSDATSDQNLDTKTTIEEPKTTVDDKGNVSYQDGSVSVKAKVKGDATGNNSGRVDLRVNDKQVDVNSKSPGAGTVERKDGVFKIEGTNYQKAASVRNEPVEISGMGNSITLVGKITNLKVTGNQNVIFVDYVQNIELNGLNNDVYWKFQTDGADPVVVKKGLGNLVEKRDFQ
jgi:hypothetical protein